MPNGRPNFDLDLLEFVVWRPGFIWGEAIWGQSVWGPDFVDGPIVSDFTSLVIDRPCAIEQGLFVHAEPVTATLTTTNPDHMALRGQRLQILYDGEELFYGTVTNASLVETVEVGNPQKRGNTAVRTHRVTLRLMQGTEVFATSPTPPRFFTTETLAVRLQSLLGTSTTGADVSSDVDVDSGVMENVGPWITDREKVLTLDDKGTLLDTIRGMMGPVGKVLRPFFGLGYANAESISRVVVVPLNANPYFETDAANWTVTGGTFVRSTAQFHEGVASGLLTPDGVSTETRAQSEHVIPVTAGEQIQAAAWIRCAVARSIDIHILWYDAADVLLSSDGVGTAVAANTWTPIGTLRTAPAGTARASIRVRMTGTPPGSNLLHIDEATLTRPMIATTLRFTDSPTLFGVAHISYTERQVSEDAQLFPTGVAVTISGVRYGPYDCSSQQRVAEVDLGVMDYAGRDQQTARNFAATCPLKRTPRAFTSKISAPAQPALFTPSFPVPRLAVLHRDGVEEQIAVVGVTHTISPAGWLMDFDCAPAHLLTRHSDLDPSPVTNITVTQPGGAGTNVNVEWRSPKNLPTDVPIYRSVFWRTAIIEGGSMSFDAGNNLLSHVLVNPATELPDTLQSVSIAGVAAGLKLFYVQYTSDPFPPFGVFNASYRQGQARRVGFTVT